jgi:hypothetical protein
MNINLTRRVTALEGTLTPHGKVIPIWAMRRDGKPMTDLEIEQEISGRALPNANFISIVWAD